MGERQIEFIFSGEGQQRLDKFLAGCLPDFSRSRIQRWIRDGRVTVEGQVAEKTGFQLDEPATISVRIPPTQPSVLVPEPIPLHIVFENEDLLVVDKPAGMVVHPSAGHTHGTLVHAALAHAPGMEGVGGVQRPGVVHRLDKQTSGLILLAKNDRAHHWLQHQFRTRSVEKVYLALVDGGPPTPTGRVEVAIGRDVSHRTRMAVVPAGKGRPAVSDYTTLESLSRHTLLQVRPITGRTHQIRVHMAFLGCPVVGDRVYGYRRPSLPVRRHFLHAFRLTLRLPGEEQLQTFETPLPAELTQVLENLSALGLWQAGGKETEDG